jgi:hypothetical protein
MIGITLTCTRHAGFNSDPCPQFHATLEPFAAEAWYHGTILDNAWTVEDGKPYCPRHNPADNGALIEVKYGDDYQPIGTSGWEIRLPRDGSPIGWFKVEVRQIRKDGAK